MSVADLDLETGEPERSDSTRESRRRRSRSDSTTSARAEAKIENEIREGLSRAFEGMAKVRDAAEDDELADALREEADAMSEAVVILTDGVPFLRNPILILVHVAIALLAFGRIGGILYNRRRARLYQEQQEYDVNGVPVEVQ